MLPKMKEQRGRLDYEYLEMFSMAMSSIVGNKMRSILTMLGIIIGITAVIALVSLMSGMTSEITETFEEMGIESINVSIQDRSATKEVKPEEMEQLAEEHSDNYCRSVTDSFNACIYKKTAVIQFQHRQQV